MMPGLIQKTNDIARPKLVWVEPFGTSIVVPPGGDLRIEFDCDEKDVVCSKFWFYDYLRFPTGTLVKAIVQDSDNGSEIELNSSETSLLPSGTAPAIGLNRFINHLRKTISTNEDYEFVADCINSLGRIDTPAAIEALFCVYNEVEDHWFDDLAKKEILEALGSCDKHSPENRVVFTRYLDFLHDVISPASYASSYFWRDAMRILRWIADDNPKTIDLVLKIAIEEGKQDDENWEETRELAIEVLRDLAPHLLDEHPVFRQIYNQQQRRRDELMYDANDPIWFCNVCSFRFPRPKENGFICDQCNAEVGVDDDANYRQAYLAKKNQQERDGK